MLRFVGCDVHKRTAMLTILHADGTVLATHIVPVTREALAAFAERQLSSGDRLAMEATTNTWAVAGVLRPFVKEIVISNPLKVRAIAEAKIKTDKVDSRVLGNCCVVIICRWCGSRMRDAAVAAADAPASGAGEQSHPLEESPALHPASWPDSVARKRSVQQERPSLAARTVLAGRRSAGGIAICGCWNRPSWFATQLGLAPTGGPASRQSQGKAY